MTRLAAFLLGATALLAADEKKVKPELPAAIGPLVELARATAPEIFANTIADLVEKGAVPDNQSRSDLLEEAFAVAQEAKEPYRVMAIPATPQDTRALHRSKAAELKLDALSLESRMVKEMIRIDRMKARAMFDAVPRPVLDARPCEDPLIADVSAYYEMAAAIAQSTFTEAQKEKNAQVQFLEAMLDGARSPGELLPFLQTINAVTLSAAQRELLMGALAAKMASIGVDYRPFAMTYEALKAEVEGLSAADREVLAPAFGGYVFVQASAPRCGPDIGSKIYAGEEEIRPSKMAGGIVAESYFQSADSRQIVEELVALRNLPRRGHWEAEWSNRLGDFLRDFSAWNPSEEDIDLFHQRATIFRALLEMTPRGEDYDRILAMGASFLETAAAQQEHPEEWLYQVEMLTGAPGLDGAKMLSLFRASGDPALTLYAAMQPGT
jgi:hypothetical protein